MAHGIFDEAHNPAKFAAEPEERRGTYVLVVQGQVKGAFSSNGDALRAALKDYALDDFAVLRAEPQAA